MNDEKLMAGIVRERIVEQSNPVRSFRRIFYCSLAAAVAFFFAGVLACEAVHADEFKPSGPSESTCPEIEEPK